MTIERALVGTTDAAAVAANYIEDCFSTYLYTGTGAARTINNGIDLATKGGLVWIKSRSTVAEGVLYDTARSPMQSLRTNSNAGEYYFTSDVFQSFETSGFSLGADASWFTVNKSGSTYTSWTFRKQAKFFDIVTYTGTGSATTIAHSLGATPGMIIVKRMDITANWRVYHNGLTSAANSIPLNSTAAQASATTVWNSTAPTSSVFSVGTDASVNASGGKYVAYLYAASNSGGFGPAGTDSVVACGSYTGNGSASGPTITLGWEPQFVLVKMASSTGNWNIFDNMRGIPTGSADPYLLANTDAAEATTKGDLIDLTATGFQIKGTNVEVNTSAGTYIYLAIRRGPMKTPTDATKVFAPVTYTGNGTTKSVVAGFPIDATIFDMPARDFMTGAMPVDRLRGKNTFYINETGAEFSETSFQLDNNTGIYLNSAGTFNSSTRNYISWNFRRAPGFFDVVCYTGTGSARTVEHNLGVAPELMIVKCRSEVQSWAVYNATLGATKLLSLASNATATTSSIYWNDTTPTSNVFTVGVGFITNKTSATYVAYLFATCPGVSKVGSYTGSGTTKQIDCGFTSGARFVLIKRTDSTGNWTVWDTARGIVSGNDPYLLLNSTAAEVTNTDYIDPYSAGFEISSTAPAEINASGGSFVFLAIA